jgi:dTDP-4-amino-4,6-dideoxygalactose transaminase
MTLAGINDLRRHTAALGDSLDHAIARVVRSGWFVLGPEVEAFEQEFARYCGARHCIAVANGTDALELSLRCLGAGHASRVLTVANAGMYAASAIRAVGAEPAFMDVDDSTLLAGVRSLRRAFEATPQATAVVVTHLYGRVGDVAELVATARELGLRIVEDCAQSHGARVDGKAAGTFGDVGCFSFYPTKNLGALGDGGAIVTDDEGLAQALRQLRQYGWTRKYHATTPGGRNSRLDELQAAVLRVKLPHLDAWNERRRAIAARYSAQIDNRRIRCPPRSTGSEYVAHLYVVRSAMRAQLAAHLAARKVPCDIHYPVPDYAQPALARCGNVESLAVTDAACREVLTLPCFPEMTDDEVSAVVDAVNTWTD